MTYSAEHKHIKFLNDIVKTIVNQITVEEKTISFPFPSNLHYIPLLTSELINDEAVLAKMQEARYFISFRDDFGRGQELNDVLAEMKSTKEFTYPQLVERFISKLEKIYSNSPDTYKFYFPINIKNDNIGNIKKAGFEVFNKSYKELESIMQTAGGKKSLGEMGFKIVKDINSIRFIVHEVKARNFIYADKTANERAGFLMNIIAWGECYGRSTVSMFEGVSPLSRIEFSYCLFSKNNEDIKLYGQFDFEAKGVVEIDQFRVDLINSFLEKFNNANAETEKLIVRSLDSYYSGIKEKKLPVAFISLWTAAEILCLKKQNMSESEVKNRIKSIFDEVSEADHYDIERFYRLRNEYIHEANVDDITQHDRNRLKMYVQGVIGFFINNLSSYSLDDINEIYGNLRKGVSRLESNKGLIDYVIGLLNKKKKKGSKSVEHC